MTEEKDVITLRWSHLCKILNHLGYLEKGLEGNESHGTHRNLHEKLDDLIEQGIVRQVKIGFESHWEFSLPHVRTAKKVT